MRRRWRSWLAIALLTSVVGGVVLATAAAGRRTESAFPRFVHAHGFDAWVYTFRPTPGIAMLPGVVATTLAVAPDSGQPGCACSHPVNPDQFGVLFEPSQRRPSFVLVSGRMPDPSDPHQVLASFILQHDEGLRLGSVIRVPFYAPSQASAYNVTPSSLLEPTGPTVPFRIVGFEATEPEFPSGGAPFYDLYTTAAFARSVLPRTGVSYEYFVKLRHGAADLPRFDTAATNLAGVGGYQNIDTLANSVESSIHPQAVGWWALAALAALVGLVVLGQALARQSVAESEDYPAMAALGADRRQLVAMGTARNAVVGVLGALGAVVVAIALSPLAPLGEARSAEGVTGVSVDAPVLVLGSLVTMVVVLALGAWPALRAARTLRSPSPRSAPRPSSVASRLADLGAPPTAVVGVRGALERRASGSPVPVGSALLGTVLAVIALCGTAVFGASLSHLTATPRLYGDTFQLNVNNPAGGGAPDARLIDELEHDRSVTGITEGIAPPEVSVDNVAVSTIAGTAIRGPLLLSTVEGHVPNADGQIGLGATVMREVGAHVGSVVHVTVSLPSGGKRTVPFTVVSEISFPVLGGGIVSLGNGAAFTIAGYEAAVCPPSLRQAACRGAVLASASGGGVLVSLAGGPHREAVINHYLETYGSSATLAITPTSLINFGEAVNFPLIFGAILAVFGAATLTHFLVVTVLRRRQEVGLLKVLGFVNRQVASTVAWQATTLAVVGILVGVPLGIVVGRAVWRTFATDLGAVPVSVVPAWLIAVLGLGVILVANVMAAGPALAATRSTPGELLRKA
jgi:hypothetical protein